MDELLNELFGDDERAGAWSDRIKEAVEAGYVKREAMDAMALNYAVRDAVRKAGARNERAVLALLDTGGVTLKDGEAEGVADRLAALKASDPYLFADDEAVFTGMKPAEWVRESEKRPAMGLYEAVAKHFGR